MKNANDYARLALNLRNCSASLPAEGRYADTEKLIKYHLHTAALHCEKIAADLAKNEPEPAA